RQVYFLICQFVAIFCGCILRTYIPPGFSRSKQRHFFEVVVGIVVLYMGYGHPLMVQTQKLSSLAFNINDGVKIAAGLPVIRECHKLNAIA
ncbi:hypothetical protein FBUS_10814, partial [Fasciolopsis buskii]